MGCSVYLVSRPASDTVPSFNAKHASGQGKHLDSFLGFVLLALYLFFDGFTNTMQEYYFGKSKKVVSPLTSGGPVLDQMIYVNIIGAANAIVLCLASSKDTLYSLSLVLEDTSLRTDSEQATHSF